MVREELKYAYLQQQKLDLGMQLRARQDELVRLQNAAARIEQLEAEIDEIQQQLLAVDGRLQAMSVSPSPTLPDPLPDKTILRV